jgi:hypothetical protein
MNEKERGDDHRTTRGAEQSTRPRSRARRGWFPFDHASRPSIRDGLCRRSRPSPRAHASTDGKTERVVRQSSSSSIDDIWYSISGRPEEISRSPTTLSQGNRAMRSRRSGLMQDLGRPPPGLGPDSPTAGPAPIGPQFLTHATSVQSLRSLIRDRRRRAALAQTAIRPPHFAMTAGSFEDLRNHLSRPRERSRSRLPKG